MNFQGFTCTVVALLLAGSAGSGVQPAASASTPAPVTMVASEAEPEGSWGWD
ncbi:hypothetical protein F0L17_25540 [Streptomyces sp. TRM43335]|uniref:Uncharacterized protein n=1 Tax=Streptomyces taklimakanensis TaxID=2569853 RepID=A0A6G2BJL2_9ACTN|nr:hypothetical protein [Streptomyces taklimakanensis]MTE22404.1 hypothetical protein [Streptomyces taklimakanensis]